MEKTTVFNTLFFNTLKAPAARAHQYLKSETKRLEKIKMYV